MPDIGEDEVAGLGFEGIRRDSMGFDGVGSANKSSTPVRYRDMSPESRSDRVAYGHALVTYANDQVLDAWFPAPSLGTRKGSAASTELNKLAGDDEARAVHFGVVLREIDLDLPPTDAIDVYLRLHLLSHRLVKPHGTNLEGIFGHLSNVVWTSAGPCAVDGFEQTRMRLRARGALQVFGVDKFPRMTDYVVPSGVRIADADRVRLGAHLAPGTTVMHEGFVNFNAGTLGVSMVEGRISSGVVVDDGSDIGGGASIMGTLSGGGKELVSIGKRCLLGANSGLGISLGDDCIVEAGTYITAGSKIRTPTGEVVKAGALSGTSGLLFRRNSLNGALEVIQRTGAWGGLNETLHVNQ